MVRLPGRPVTRPPRSFGYPRAPHSRPAADRGTGGSRPGVLRAAVTGRSVAGQVFVLQVVIVLLLVVSAVVAQVLQVRRDSDAEAGNRSLAVAETFANAPGTAAALRSPDPTAVLQPRAEAARKATGVDFIVVMNTDGIRYTHPRADRIGKKFVGTIAPAVAGGTVTEHVNGTIGALVQVVVPVKDSGGQVVGLVAAGITTAHVGGAADQQLPLLLAAAAAALALATAGTALVSRRLLRQTHGLGPYEMTRMYEHHDAVLHAVREGVLIVGGDGRLLLANDEAHRLLGLPADAERRHVLELGLDDETAGLLASGRVATDEVHLVKDRLLAVNQRPTDLRGGPPGSVTTLRDSTELRALSGRAEVARERLNMLYEAGVGIGTSLDVTRTAEELTELAVPRFADFATVDLFDAVLGGEEPRPGTALRRAACAGVREESPLYPLGERIRFVTTSPQARALTTGQSVEVPRLRDEPGWRAQDLERTDQVLAFGIHSMITVPLRAGSLVLGVASFWRAEKPQPFDAEELALAEELRRGHERPLRLVAGHPGPVSARPAAAAGPAGRHRGTAPVGVAAAGPGLARPRAGRGRGAGPAGGAVRAGPGGHGGRGVRPRRARGARRRAGAGRGAVRTRPGAGAARARVLLDGPARRHPGQCRPAAPVGGGAVGSATAPVSGRRGRAGAGGRPAGGGDRRRDHRGGPVARPRGRRRPGGRRHGVRRVRHGREGHVAAR
ncbi:hypothetical protein SCANM63S_03721 [Streptomyces canarius]